ncbi:hypothetical protein BJF86_02410 [Serinicoccus sp. CNJ-927]|uniref:Wzz/FepE/Etk N-terminal domain-containing protein n=1 Tax=Serinicoccus sp. CNJ-927 TaxID=1904970 RepID=UPI000958FC60|nr:Wzz/FepE/Etk N-terminal domain-containing protein [Serinicoccus sp. CNJ-927]OLT41880.1 hypothetical protein BJF86_02410 [Serinicoccus sp. CNJ-927]
MYQQHQEDVSVDLRRYLEILWRRWWVVLLSVVLCVGAGVAFLALAPRQATATASVSINLITSDPFDVGRPVSELIDPAGEAQVASSFVVAERAAESLGGDQDAASVRSATEAVSVANTAVLRISATAGSEDQARAIADASANAFLEYRSELAQNRIERRVEQSNARLDELREELKSVNERIAALGEDSDAAIEAQSDRTLISLEIDALSTQLATARGIDTNGGTVISPAAAGQVEYQPSPLLVLLTSAAAGLGLGVILAFVLQGLRPRAVSRGDIRNSGGEDLLGQIDRTNTQMPPEGEGLAAYREIRERLLAGGLVAGQHGLLAVLPIGPAAVSRGVPLSLARVLAQSGTPVEFIALHEDDVEVQQLRQALALGEPEVGEAGARYVAADLPTFSLFVPQTGSEDEPLSSAVRQEIERRRSSALVMVSVPEHFGRATRLAASRLADASVLVAVRGRTLTSTLRRTTHDVALQGGTVLGTVLVDRRRKAQPGTGEVSTGRP